MKSPTVAELLFSFKSFFAAMLALYIAMSIGLPRPFWAMLTAYVVANPLSGAVRSKALYRFGGTLLGSAATVLLVPRLANAPELLSLALAVWVGICLYISLLDRTPRSYVFMLAGYTAALIGFPVVGEPATVFDVAVARVEEILLGIACGTVVHSLLFPQSLGPVLLARLDHALADARRWTLDLLAPAACAGSSDASDPGQGALDRRKLAADITELRLMSTHLPFDTSHLRWTADAVGALQDRLAEMIPFLSGIQDRIAVLNTLNTLSAVNVPSETESGRAEAKAWRILLEDIAHWIRQDIGDAAQEDASVARLRRRIEETAPAVHADANWSTVVQVNLFSRLDSLVGLWQECRRLRRIVDAGLRDAGQRPDTVRTRLSPRILHRDHGLALLSSAAAVIAIASCCAFWIITAWPAGSAAAMMAAVFCCFFATQDDPVPGIMLFLRFTIYSIPVSALYLLVVLPAIHSFEMLVLVTAPLFLLLGVFIARPATTGKAMAFLFGVAGTLSMHDTGTADMVSFINSMLGQIIGIGAAAVFTRLLRSVNAGWTARRLLHAGWKELAAMGRDGRKPSVSEVTARMVDRIGLLTPRLAMAGSRDDAADLAAVDALGDLRIGLNLSQLLAVRTRSESGALALQSLIDGLSEHFRRRPGQPAAAESGLLARLDETLRAACASAQREAVAALVGIRRDMFPAAPPYSSRQGAGA